VGRSDAPALAGGGVFDLDAQGAGAEVAGSPVVPAQPPLRLKRDRNNLLDQLPTDRVADERGAEEALG